MTPLLKPIGLVGGTLLLLLLGRKSEAGTPPIEPPPPAPPPPPPPGPGPGPAPQPNVPLGNEGSFPPGAILGVITSDGVRLRAGASETTAVLGTMARGTLVQLFEDGSAPPTAAAPQGWERVRTAAGTTGFVAAQFLTGQGIPGAPRETPEPERPDLGPPIDVNPNGGLAQGTETETNDRVGPAGGVIDDILDLFSGAPRGNAFFSPMIGTRAPAYGQTQFVAPRPAPAGFGATPRLRSARFEMARAARMARRLTPIQILAAQRQAAAAGQPHVAAVLQALYLKSLRRPAPMRG